MRIFWKKIVKNATASGAPPPNPRWQTPALQLSPVVAALCRVRF